MSVTSSGSLGHTSKQIDELAIVILEKNQPEFRLSFLNRCLLTCKNLQKIGCKLATILNQFSIQLLSPYPFFFNLFPPFPTLCV